MPLRFLAIVAAALFPVLPAVAATDYSEAVSGDLAGSAGPANVDLGPLGPAQAFTVTGTLDAGETLDVFGDGPDEQDSFRFTAAVDFAFDLAVVSGAPVCELYEFAGPDLNLLGDCLGQVWAPASYAVALVMDGNQGQGGYALTAQAAPVPAPAAGALLAGACAAGLALSRRGRRGA
ncbi:hypothetical protein P2H44_12170 [Albimonas sp. CAU 1670]|uniref:hypothetical protein n=1 Tax=Albimonas sp. CAU 1670 TaxID=3032599 RepID=UPI0023D9DF63|nr:hypothetical protein [Albimonas sp. CAU 1670]MDF2233309.1 hypothetical protein [Albimonas sp. CAU 1670]